MKKLVKKTKSFTKVNSYVQAYWGDAHSAQLTARWNFICGFNI